MPERFAFSDLRELFAKANEEKSGDHLAGLAAGSGARLEGRADVCHSSLPGGHPKRDWRIAYSGGGSAADR